MFFEFEFIHQISFSSINPPPLLTINNFDGIFVESWIVLVERERSWERGIDRKWKVIYPCEPFFNRAHHPRSILLLARAWQHLSLRGGHLYSTRVLRETRARRKKERGGGGRGKEGGKKWNGLSTRFDFRSGIHCRRHRFTSDIRSSSSLSCAIDSSDFCLRILARHARTQGVPLNPYLRYI